MMKRSASETVPESSIAPLAISIKYVRGGFPVRCGSEFSMAVLLCLMQWLWW